MPAEQFALGTLFAAPSDIDDPLSKDTGPGASAATGSSTESGLNADLSIMQWAIAGSVSSHMALTLHAVLEVALH